MSFWTAYYVRASIGCSLIRLLERQLSTKSEGFRDRVPGPPGAGSVSAVDFDLSQKAGANGRVGIENLDVDQVLLAEGFKLILPAARLLFDRNRSAGFGRQRCRDSLSCHLRQLDDLAFPGIGFPAVDSNRDFQVLALFHEFISISFKEPIFRG